MQGLDGVSTCLNDPLGDFVNHLSSAVRITRCATGGYLDHAVTSEKLLSQRFLLLKSLQPNCTAL